MSEFALRADDGDIHPEQIAYVDGYGIAERLLEGVRFKVEAHRQVFGGAPVLKCNGVHPDDEAYMAKFSSAQRAEWNAEAVKWLTDNDGDATAEDGTNVHWGGA